MPISWAGRGGSVESLFCITSAAESKVHALEGVGFRAYEGTSLGAILKDVRSGIHGSGVSPAWQAWSGEPCLASLVWRALSGELCLVSLAW